MAISMYQASVPSFIHYLHNLSSILLKAAAYAEVRKIDPSVLINARLAPDMFPLSRQIQIATDIVKGGSARLAGVEVPSFQDTETTFAEFQERIAKTITFLKTITAKHLEGSEDPTVTLKTGGKELSFQGEAYLVNFVIPNFYFHITTSYAILRHNGLEVGKNDFLGRE